MRIQYIFGASSELRATFRSRKTSAANQSKVVPHLQFFFLFRLCDAASSDRLLKCMSIKKVSESALGGWWSSAVCGQAHRVNVGFVCCGFKLSHLCLC